MVDVVDGSACYTVTGNGVCGQDTLTSGCLNSLNCEVFQPVFPVMLLEHVQEGSFQETFFYLQHLKHYYVL